MLKRLRARLAYRAERDRNRHVKERVIAPLMQSVAADAAILEIGAGYNPRFSKGGAHHHVYHLDHADTATLRAKYAAIPAVAHLVDRIQEVDFVVQGGTIEAAIPPDLRFDVIFGSHCLEHQVDLIGHLQSLERLLKPNGRVIEVIPDLRRCFDLLRYPSVTADVLLAHLRCPPIHQGKQVFDTLAREINLNLGRLPSETELAQAGFARPLDEAYQAMRAAEQPGAPYRDLHAWTFTPESFRLLLIELQLLGLVGLQARLVSPVYDNQFCAVLGQAPGGRDQAATRALEAERLELAKRLRVLD